MSGRAPRDGPILLTIFGAETLRHCEAAGVTAIPRNAGNRRTGSKQALLQLIEAAGGKW